MFHRRALPFRSAWFYRARQLPILLGVALAAMVLTGSLILGDSLRGSLRERSLRKLQGVESSYTGTRLLTQSLAAKLPGDVAPALLMQGSLAVGEERRLNRVSVIGVSPEAAKFFGLELTGTQTVLGARVAAALKLQPGDKLDLAVERFSNVPRSSLLGAKNLDDITAKVSLEVASVLPPEAGANDFDLTPNPAAPLNIYVSVDYLQTRLGKPGRVNMLLTKSGDVATLNTSLRNALTLDDWLLRLQTQSKRNAYISVESEQLILDLPTVAAIEATAKDLGWPCERTLSYLANTIAQGQQPILKRETPAGRKYIPYSVVAGLRVEAAAPLGPFANGLADDEILLTDWAESPLKALTPGETISVAFFKPEMEASAEETHTTFKLRGYVPLTGVMADPNLTPPFPGITDKLKIGDWESPFEMEPKRIQRRDEDYWNQHKTTPKAIITSNAAEKLFGSRFGVVTSMRVAPPTGQTPAQAEEVFRKALLAKLDATRAGIVFQPTKARLLESSQGGTDFGMMFLFFSFLLIGAALLLVGLLFRLAIERRAKEVGLFLALGYAPKQVRRLLTTEGLLVAGLGAVLGIGLSWLYASQLLGFLVSLWPDAEVGSYLRVHISPLSPILGLTLTLLTAWATIRLSLRGLMDVPPPSLLRGQTESPTHGQDGHAMDRGTGFQPVLAGKRWWRWAVVGMLLAAIAALAIGPTRTNPDERAGGFFTGGLLLLGAGLLAARIALAKSQASQGIQPGSWALVRLGLRNAARNPLRTILSAALIAGSMFLVVSVESFRRQPDADFRQLTGGSGGLPLIIEADVPIFQPFDRDPGRDDLLESLRKVYQRARSTEPTEERLTKASDTLTGLTTYPFRLQAGDDASCLNLAQAGQPRILGVPEALITRGGFRFTQTLATTDAERANPWELLDRKLDPLADGRPVIPVLAEQNTVFFMLKTFPGGIVEIPDETGRLMPVKIVGLLQDSVFQSDLLMSDENFRNLFPRTEGFRFFLADAPEAKREAINQLLETGLRANGAHVTRAEDRVAMYQAVIGAYLSTFQLLGALALLLAILGLSVVILRNVSERGAELALLRAVGYRYGALQTLILSETLLVLLLGLGIGITAALAAVLPNLALGGSVPWLKLSYLLAATLATGVTVAAIVTMAIARLPIIPALRKE
ncbi:MAG: FtsX-like permease family protein [Fimbriiglobus sp.]